MTHLELNNIAKIYPGGVRAVADFNLVVEEGDFVVLVGPSGCGKTTVLRMIAGLESVDEGSITLDGVEVSRVAPKERGISMTFQDYALYPHLTVRQNIAFPLQMHRFPKARVAQMVEEIAASLQIEEVLDRKPGALSGGQRQRVAIARALVRNPKICLMDEPFSNLDAQLRVQMRGELARIHREHNMTVVFVTHDQVEAMALGTRIVVMKDGVMQQAASSQQLYLNPANLFVASFFGTPPMNTYPAALHCERGVWRVRLRGAAASGIPGASDASGTAGEHAVELDRMRAATLDSAYNGASVVLGIRPEHFQLADVHDTGAPSFSVTIERTEELGSESYLYASYRGEPFVMRTTQFASNAVGSAARITFNPADCYLFDAASGANLFDDRSPRG